MIAAKSWPLACVLSLAPLGESPRQARVQLAQGDSVVVGPFDLAGPTLGELVPPLARIANRTLLIRPEVARRLESNRFCLVGEIRVPKARAEELLESILFSCWFVLLPPSAEELPWEVVDAKGADRNRIRESVRAIELNEIESYSTRYVLVSVAIGLDHVNARDVSASLRPFFPDSGLETIVNVGDSNTLRVTGFGPTVATLARLLRQIDKNEPATGGRSSGRRAEIEALKARVSALEKKLEAAPEKPK